MAEKREPYIEGHRVDSSVSTTVSDSKVKVYVGIEADTGTYDLTYQQTPKLFVQEYSTKSKPDTNDASTLLHAGKLVENFGIYVKRVNKDSILPGIVSTGKYGEVGYFDTNFNLINTYTQFRFAPKFDEVTDQKLAMVIDNVLYINSNITSTADLLEAFGEGSKPKYLNKSGSPSDMIEVLDATSADLTTRGAQAIIVTVADVPEVAFRVINVGNKFSVENFLSEVASWAKNYRSNEDPSEFISYEPLSLLLSMDVSTGSNDESVVQVCKLLSGYTTRLVKNYTKIEFTEGGRSLLTNSWYKESPSDDPKYLDISGFRYVPKIKGDDVNYADSTVTLKRCTFGGVDFINSDTDHVHCTVSDAILSSVDSMVADSDTVKPELAYCSTQQVFKLKYQETNQGISIVPSAVVSNSDGTEKYLVTTGFYGDGFKKSLVSFEILDINGKWVEVKPGTSVENQFIDSTGYAYIRLKFDGKINAIGSDKAGIAIVYTTYNQSGGTISNTYHVAFIGQNVKESDISLFNTTTAEADCTFNNVTKVTINKDTTDLGTICNLPNVTLSGYGFQKVTEGGEISYGHFKDIPPEYDPTATYEVGDKCTYDGKYYECKTAIETAEEWTASHWTEYELDSYTAVVEPSNIDKLYLYFLKSRNVTIGITGYSEACWRKFDSLFQRNYIFQDQDTVSEGLPSYHAILFNKTVYFNGIKGQTSQIPSGWRYDNEVSVSTSDLTPSDFIEAFYNSLRDNYSVIAKLNDSSYIINQEIKKDGDDGNDGIKTTEKLKLAEYGVIDQKSAYANARYAIIQRFTSAAKSFSIELTFDKTDKEILKFVNSYNGTEYTDKISFNVGKIDGYGTNISYKSYNLYDGRAFFIKELNPEFPVIEMEVPSFGNDVTPKKATSQDYVNALDDLISDEFKPSFLWDAGLCDNSYTDALTSLADKTYSMVPISVPKYESASQIKSWKSAFNVDNPVQYILDGWHYNTVFGDISFECCPTYYYLIVKLSNANSISKEFQTAFYKTRGIVSAGTPVRNVALKKSEREELLDLRINSIVRNKANSISYINQNFTNQQVESDFSEEQNVCISNEVCRTADDYADHNIIAKNNTENLRATVTSELTRLIRERIMDSRGDDTAQSFYVECNKVNNPESIIKARKLVIDVWVTYNKSVNAVLVYSRTKSLDQG